VLRVLLLAAVLTTVAATGEPVRAADAPSAASASAIPFKKEQSEASSSWGNALASLIVVLGIGWAGVYALRRFRFMPAALGGGDRRIRLVEATRLDARVTLYLVVADGRSFLLGRCGDSLVMVKDLGAAGASDGGGGP
jgi:flagellar biogenesis protein FliO